MYFTQTNKCLNNSRHARNLILISVALRRHRPFVAHNKLPHTGLWAGPGTCRENMPWYIWRLCFKMILLIHLSRLLIMRWFVYDTTQVALWEVHRQHRWMWATQWSKENMATTTIPGDSKIHPEKVRFSKQKIVIIKYRMCFFISNTFIG